MSSEVWSVADTFYYRRWMMKNSSVKTFLRMLQMLISGQHSQVLTTINCTELRIHQQSPDHCTDCTLPHLGPIQVTGGPSCGFVRALEVVQSPAICKKYTGNPFCSIKILLRKLQKSCINLEKARRCLVLVCCLTTTRYPPSSHFSASWSIVWSTFPRTRGGVRPRHGVLVLLWCSNIY